MRTRNYVGFLFLLGITICLLTVALYPMVFPAGPNVQLHP